MNKIFVSIIILYSQLKLKNHHTADILAFVVIINNIIFHRFIYN